MKIIVVTCFLFFTTACNGQSWHIIKTEIIVSDPPFKQCHASTLVELQPGKLMAAWFGGSGEGQKDVVIWASVSENGKWSKPVVIADGIITDSLRYPCWNPVLFKAKEGKLYLYYKVGPSPQRWWGMQISSTDDGITWSKPIRLPGDIVGPVKNKPIQLPDGNILSASSTEAGGVWKVQMERTMDTDDMWMLIPVDTSSAFEVIQPTILQYGNGRLQILCRSKQGVIVQAWSDDWGFSWGKLSATEIINPNSGIDAVTLKNGLQLLVYNPDKPGKEWFNGRARLHVAVSKDGEKWKDIAVLENGTTEEFSYPAVIQASDGKVHITYTYDRKNIKYVVLEQ